VLDGLHLQPVFGVDASAFFLLWGQQLEKKEERKRGKRGKKEEREGERK
jgi:hypothetical protein